jgi:hypothetical protein
LCTDPTALTAEVCASVDGEGQWYCASLNSACLHEADGGAPLVHAGDGVGRLIVSTEDLQRHLSIKVTNGAWHLGTGHSNQRTFGNIYRNAECIGLSYSMYSTVARSGPQPTVSSVIFYPHPAK